MGPGMIPMFTIVTTIITVGVTALLVYVLYRINLASGLIGRSDAGAPETNSGDDPPGRSGG